MHEISLVRNVFNTLEAEFSEEELSRMTAIDMKVGLLSNVQPILMQNAFEAVKAAEQKYLTTQLNVEVIPIEVHCSQCLNNSIVKNYVFKCSFCDTPTNDLVTGEELLIHQVHFSDS